MAGSVHTFELNGDAYTRGAAYGTASRERIRACLTDWQNSLRAAGIGEPVAHFATFLGDTDFLSAIRAHCPDLLEEVRGISAGAAQPFDLLFAAQLMDEEWAYRASVPAQTVAAEKCSSLAILGTDDTMWIGQNMDLGGYTEGHQILFRLAPREAEPGALIFSIGSMIALMGVNTCRIGVCVNSIPQLPSARSGLPVAFVIRRLLQSRTLAEAVEFVRTVPHATGQHYLIADAEAIRSFEASPAGVVEYTSGNPARVFHTNHPLAAVPEGTPASSANSIARLRSLNTRLRAGQQNLASIQAALSSCDDPNHPVSRVRSAASEANPLTGMISFTTGSMISSLRTDSVRVDSWISPGPPSLHPYAHFTLP